MADSENTRLLPLAQGKFALIDTEDFERLSKHKWHTNHYGYAIRFATAAETGSGYIKKIIWLHRDVLNAPSDKCVDHINLNKSDARKSNLRLCSHAENCRNIPSKGVGFHKKSGKWRAYIRFNYKQIECLCATYEDAVIKRKEMQKKYFGEFANISNP